jgi:flagellar FliJ protein
MKLFKFSLQRLLDVKLARERAVEQKLSGVLRTLKEARKQLRVLQDRLQAYVRCLEESAGRRTSNRRILDNLRYIERIQTMIVHQSREIVQCEEAVEEVRQELLAIMQERKSLERLRGRERRKWLEQVRRGEQKHMDEVAGAQFYRNQKADAPEPVIRKKTGWGAS